VQRPLAEHIAQLEEKIVKLKRELRKTDLPENERTDKEISLLNAEEALRLRRMRKEIRRWRIYRQSVPVRDTTQLA
jgi:hypothetical protein